MTREFMGERFHMIAAKRTSIGAPSVLGVLVVFGAIVLCILVALSPARLVYDEGLHLQQVETLSDSGFWTMLTEPSSSAAGPVYPVLHSALSPWTALSAPAVRVLNLALTVATIGLLALTLFRYGCRDVWQRAGFFLAVPMVWVTAGMALTEIPSTFFMTAAVASLAAVPPFREEIGTPSQGRVWLLFLVAGVFIGLAILSRQTYLPALIFPFLTAAYCRRLLLPAIASSVVAVLMMLPVLVAWGGLVPPGQERAAGGIVIAHGAVAFGYIAITVGILAPAFFRPALRPVLFVGLAFLSLALAWLLRVDLLPMRSVAESLLPSTLLGPAGTLGGAAWIGAAGLFGWSCLIHLFENWRDARFTVNCLLVGLMGATSLGVVHLVSSRYAMVVFPFLLLMLQPWIDLTRWTALRLTFGAALGALALASYFGML